MNESGWVIERGQNQGRGLPIWWAGDRVVGDWTSDEAVAVRFARKSDGELIARRLIPAGYEYAVVESICANEVVNCCVHFDHKDRQTKFEKRYLGDGVYASFNGYQIWLDTRGQKPVNMIALDPAVLYALNAYSAYIRQVCRSRSTEGP